MAWRRPGDKPLSEPMMASLLTHICIARPQSINADCTQLILHYMFLGNLFRLILYFRPLVKVKVTRWWPFLLIYLHPAMSLMNQVQVTISGVWDTKQTFSVPLILAIFLMIPKHCQISPSYLSSGTAAKLHWHLTIMRVIQRTRLIHLQNIYFYLTEILTNEASVSPTPDWLPVSPVLEANAIKVQVNPFGTEIEYSMKTRSISWLLMSWLLVSPGHH